MELQNAVSAASGVGEKMGTGSSTPLGKSSGTSTAEMHSAFEAMMGSLLGMLSAGQPVMMNDTSAQRSVPGGNLTELESTAGKPTLESLFTQINGKPLQAATGQVSQEAALLDGESQKKASMPTLAAAQPVTAQIEEPSPLLLGEQTTDTQTGGQPNGGEGAETFLATQTKTQTQNIETLVTQSADAIDEIPEKTPSLQPTVQSVSDQSSQVGAAGITVSGTTAPAAPPVSQGDTLVTATPIEQINEQVQVSLGRGKQDVTIQLHPNELGSVRQEAALLDGESQKKASIPTLAAAQPVTAQIEEPSPLLLGEQTTDTQTGGQPNGREGAETFLATQTKTQTQNIETLVTQSADAIDEIPEKTPSLQPTVQSVSDQSSQVGAAGITVSGTTAPAAPPVSQGDTLVTATPIEQINEQVQVSLGRREQDVTIQLHPNELGSVRIRLQMENGQLHLSIRAEQPETSRLLNGKLADLRQSLEGQGIKVGELAVARTERTQAAEAVAREVTSAVRSGQMDMNPNNSNSPRQQMFAGSDFGGGFSENQNNQGRQPITNGDNAHTADVLPIVEPGQVLSASRGQVAVDYYI